MKDHESIEVEFYDLLDEYKYTPNEFGEIEYKPKDNEKEISVNAGNSRDYTQFFSEFWPNQVPKEKRKHHYSVSLHPSIGTEEAWVLYK